jgi:hypothetical protein
MRKLISLIIVGLFLIGFVSAGITSKAIVNNSNDKGNPSIVSSNDLSSNSKRGLNESQIKLIKTERNRLRANAEAGECPEKCTCTGSAMKCQFANGTREMTITAGKSGNTILQVKGIDASTQVTLYKADDGKLYAVKKNNETKEVKMLPDQVKERIRERLQKQLENENITLDEDGNYRYEGKNKAKLFGLFSVKEKVNAEINAETGKVEKLQKPWWAFLAKEEGELIVGASCGTVTPGYNDECCQNKGYNTWDTEAGECIFSSE